MIGEDDYASIAEDKLVSVMEKSRSPFCLSRSFSFKMALNGSALVMTVIAMQGWAGTADSRPCQSYWPCHSSIVALNH